MGEGTEVTRAGGGFLATPDEVDEIREEARAIGSLGVSGAREDNIVPFLLVLQDGSPQVKARDPAYINGAQPGMILLTSTKQLLTKTLFQPCHFAKKWVEWLPRDAGGGGGKGFVATHEGMPAGARNITKDGKVNKNAWYDPDTGNIYAETRYHIGNILDEEAGTVVPAVIGMTSTQHTVSRQWMALMNSFRLGGVPAPSFFRAYELGTVEKRNPQGTWFVFSVRDRGWVSKPLRELGHDLYDSVEAGEKVADTPQEAGDEAGEKEVPF